MSSMVVVLVLVLVLVSGIIMVASAGDADAGGRTVACQWPNGRRHKLNNLEASFSTLRLHDRPTTGLVHYSVVTL